MSYRDEVMALRAQNIEPPKITVCGLSDGLHFTATVTGLPLVGQANAAEIAARADARIAELELECAQWRLELRIYRETENARIAELERSVTVRDTEIARLETDLELARMTERERICSAIKATDDAASECGYMLDSDDCIAVARGELGPANYEDAARAGNGGGG